MDELKIYGASDDLIEIEGAISEEFNAWSSYDDAHWVLAVSDGTLLDVYRDDGGWRFAPLVKGTAFQRIEQGTVEPYVGTDHVFFAGDNLNWVALGEEKAIRRR